MIVSDLNLFFIGAVLNCLALFAVSIDAVGCSLVLYILSFFVICFACVKSRSQFFSLAIVFWFFSMMYGIICPLKIYFGIDFFYVFPKDVFRHTQVFLTAFYLSCIGFCLGNSFGGLSIVKKMAVAAYMPSLSIVKIVAICCVSFAFLASLFEMINFVRAGGSSILLMGKGTYQSACNNLTLTLPSNGAYAVFGIFMGLLLAWRKMYVCFKIKPYLISSCILIIPFAFVNVFLGMRGILVSAILSGLASFSFFHPVKRISIKILALVAVLYLFMQFLYVNRGNAPLIFSDPKSFVSIVMDEDRFSEKSDLASGEFGAPFGNFCTFYGKYQDNYEKYYGLSYLQAVAASTPGFLYPGEKPKQITYVFRDEFFSSWKNLSAIGGTGFSSILEAYWNWGWYGIFFVYFVVAFIITKLDYARNDSPSLNYIFFYSLLVSPCMSFSRNALGAFGGQIILNSVMLMVFFYGIQFFLRKKEI